MTATYYQEIIPNNIDFKVIRQKRRSRIEANLIITSISGVTYNLKLDGPKLSSDATNVVDFFQSLDIKEIKFVKIFRESTQSDKTEHISERIEVWLKDKPIYMIHCSKIHGLPK